MNKRDLIIIGGGAGGLVVASVASQLGLNVTLIEEQEKPGGDCLHYGCVAFNSNSQSCFTDETCGGVWSAGS